MVIPRDNWFAGYTGEHVAVVWLGRDDNKSTHLSGAAGALPVWTDLMLRIGLTPQALPQPEGVEWLWVDPVSRLRATDGCAGAVRLPFMQGTGPTETAAACLPGIEGTVGRAVEWVKGLFR